MADVIVDLQSIRIDIDEAVINAYLKGNKEAEKKIMDEAKRLLMVRIDEAPWTLIENIEVDEYLEDK